MTAALNTAPKLAIPARRAVSLSRSDPGWFLTRAINPARKEYPLSASAKSNTKLPIAAMGRRLFFQTCGAEANGGTVETKPTQSHTRNPVTPKRQKRAQKETAF